MKGFKLSRLICCLDVSGELVRKDITDGQKGVSLTFDVQLIDTNTCKPISDVALEAWYANSTVSTGRDLLGP